VKILATALGLLVLAIPAYAQSMGAMVGVAREAATGGTPGKTPSGKKTDQKRRSAASASKARLAMIRQAKEKFDPSLLRCVLPMNAGSRVAQENGPNVWLPK
jgi:hypothetical protein